MKVWLYLTLFTFSFQTFASFTCQTEDKKLQAIVKTMVQDSYNSSSEITLPGKLTIKKGISTNINMDTLCQFNEKEILCSGSETILEINLQSKRKHHNIYDIIGINFSIDADAVLSYTTKNIFGKKKVNVVNVICSF